MPFFNKAVIPPATQAEHRLLSVRSAVSYYFLLDNRKPLSQILYACCLLRHDYAKHQRKRKEKKQIKEEHEVSVQHETKQFANCSNGTRENSSDEDYHRQGQPEKRKSVRATCPWIRDRSRKRRTQSQQSEEETQSLLSRGERIIDMTNLTKRLLLNKLINPPAQLRDAHRVTELSIQEQYNHVEEHEVCRAFKSQK